MQRASELTIEQIEDILRDMNWTEIEKARIFNDYGDSVVLYTDGKFSIQDQSTYYRDPDAAGVIGYLKCWGYGNIDRTDYLEGWTERLEDGNVKDTYDGRIMTEEEAIEEAVENGDLGEEYYIEEVMRSIEEERSYREMLAKEDRPDLSDALYED